MKNLNTTLKTFLFSILLFLSHTVCAQNQDSITFCKADWNTKNIKKGIVWKQKNFSNLFSSHQEINIIEINLKKHIKNLNLAALDKKKQKTSVLAQEHNALLAVNGGFFDMKNGGAVDYIKVNNQIYYKSITKSARANGFLAFDDKKITITDDSTRVKDFANAIQSGPLLILNNNKQIFPKNAFNDNRHPRTAVAIKGNTLLLITVDGRNSNAEGMNLPELSSILQWYGANNALNLDGGGSTAMYIYGQPENGIVNYPSDNKTFDHKGERSVSNIIYLKK